MSSPVFRPRVVVLGGGLSGAATAWGLARTKAFEVTVIERGAALGGLAGSFERDGHFYPLGYHHILHRDRTLLYFLDRIGALPSVSWRRIRMLFRVRDRLFNLANPFDFLAFPMSLADKARFALMMARAFGKSDWSDWQDRSAVDLLDSWSSKGVREALFEPLTRLKFELPCEEVSGAWLGARLHHREGSAALGYIPGANWTKVLCEGVTRMVTEAGVTVRTRTSVAGLSRANGRIQTVDLDGGERIEADIVVSSIPTEVYMGFVPEDRTEHLASIRYTALVSVIAASRKKVAPDFYWMNLASLDRAACGVFLLNSLNPSIGAPGDSCVNFVTHLNSRSRPFFAKSDDELLAGYLEDFRAIFGFDLDPYWTNIARVPMYSPVFTRGYRNPPPRSTSLANVYFAGNYRTFPSIVSTGTALLSGLETADVMLGEHGLPGGLAQGGAEFPRVGSRTVIVASVALMILAGASPAAQEPAASGSLEYDKSLGLPLLAGAVASVALPPLIYKTPPSCRWCDGARIDAIDRWARKAKWEKPCRAATLSYVSLGAAGAVALLPMSHEPEGGEWLTNAGAVADSVAVTIMLTQVVKYTVRRARPVADTCHPGRSKEPDRNLSFFSGHTALAFAVVSSAHETARLRGHPTSDWIWVGGGAAAATAYFRMAGGRHYLIDVLTGAGVGYVVGRWIPRHVTHPKEPGPMTSGAARSGLAVSAPLFAYTRPKDSGGSVLLQVGKGPGRSLQLGVTF